MVSSLLLSFTTSFKVTDPPSKFAAVRVSPGFDTEKARSLGAWMPNSDLERQSSTPEKESPIILVV